MISSKNSAMPPQYSRGYPPGANSPMTAGIVAQHNQAKLQSALIGKGGSKKHIHRFIRGGTNASPVVLVPNVPSGSVSPQATGANYKEIAILAQQQAVNSVYDNAKTSGDTALIQQQQQEQYKGGRRRKSKRRKSKRRKSKSRKSKRH